MTRQRWTLAIATTALLALAAAVHIPRLVEDPTPGLGGDLTLNGHKIGAATATEIGYLSGIQEAITSAYAGKADRAGANYIVISPTDDLRAVYAHFRTATPNGAALGPNNRFTIFLRPGWYTLSDELTLDTSYLDLIALDGPNPATIQAWIDYQWYAGSLQHPGAANNLDVYNHSTVIHRAGGGCVLYQTAFNVRLHGLAIWNSGTNTPNTNNFRTNDCGLVLYNSSGISEGTGYQLSNRHESVYSCCSFDTATPINGAGGDPPYGRLGVVSEVSGSYSGTWLWCTTLEQGWKCIIDGTATYGNTLGGVFINCYGGNSGFGGDASVSNAALAPKIKGCFVNCVAGMSGFGGCSAQGTRIDAAARFWYCRARERSFAFGTQFAGKAYYCEAGPGSFGGGNYIPIYSGGTYNSSGGSCGSIAAGAELWHCVVHPRAAYDEWNAGDESGKAFAAFGGGGIVDATVIATLYSHLEGGISGTLHDCVCEDLTAPMRLKDGGKVLGGRFVRVPVTISGTLVDGPAICNSLANASPTAAPVVQGATVIVTSGNYDAIGTYQTEYWATSTAHNNASKIFAVGAAGARGTYGEPWLKAPVASATFWYLSGGVLKTCTMGAAVDGVAPITGDCSAGSVTVATGEWTLTTTLLPDANFGCVVHYETGPDMPTGVAGCLINPSIDPDNIANTVTAGGANIADPGIK